MISGSCKRETIKDQELLLRKASDALISSQRNHRRRLYCIASDGDPRHRRTLIEITLRSTLTPQSKLHALLSSLPLFNTRCGADDITSDFDWKHVFKRFRNTLLRRLKGISINNILFTVSVLKLHLTLAGRMSSATADTLLAPNGRQDVVLMILTPLHNFLLQRSRTNLSSNPPAVLCAFLGEFTTTS